MAVNARCRFAVCTALVRSRILLFDKNEGISINSDIALHYLFFKRVPKIDVKNRG
jgi:hypothetical protein